MSVQGFDHHIQRDIFLKLRQHDVARYSDLVIKTVEPSQFMYHLKELMRMGLVEKIDKGKYRLSREGIKISQNFSGLTRNITVSPLTYSFIFARSKTGRWLILQRHKQPYINLLGCVSGKVHMEESVMSAAKREWRENVGSPLPKLKYVGFTSVLIKDADTVLTHVTGPVWFIDGIEEAWNEHQALNGKLFWADWQKLDYATFIPGWKELVHEIKYSKTPFMLDLALTL